MRSTPELRRQVFQDYSAIAVLLLLLRGQYIRLGNGWILSDIWLKKNITRRHVWQLSPGKSRWVNGYQPAGW